MTAVAVPYPSPKLNPNPHQGDISEESRDLVGRMLTVDPERPARLYPGCGSTRGCVFAPPPLTANEQQPA